MICAQCPIRPECGANEKECVLVKLLKKLEEEGEK